MVPVAIKPENVARWSSGASILRIGRFAGGLVLVFFLTSADVFLDRRELLPIPSSALFMVCVLVLLSASLVCQPNIWMVWLSGLKRREIILFPLIVLALVTLINSFSNSAYWGDGANKVLLTVFDVWVIVVSCMLGMLDWVRKTWRILSRSAVVILVATIAWDLLHPGVFSNQLARGAGLGVNPNDSAFFTVFLAAASIRYDRLRAIDVLIIAISSIGVLFTLSRGGIVLQALLLTIYLTTVVLVPLLRGESGAGRGLLILVISFCVVVGGFGLIVRISPMFNDFTAKNRVAMLMGQKNALEDDEARLNLVEDYIGFINENPMAGSGAGFVARQAKGPHNMFLQMWVEKGFIGLLAYCGWLAACVYFFFRQSFYMGIVLVSLTLIESLLSHNVMDYRVFLIVLGVALGMAGSVDENDVKSLVS
jgi:O-antigen ligase